MKTHSKKYLSIIKKVTALDKSNYSACLDFLKSEYKKEFVFRVGFSLSLNGENDKIVSSVPDYIFLSFSKNRNIFVLTNEFSSDNIDFFREKGLILINLNELLEEIQSGKKIRDDIICHSKLEKEVKNLKKKLKRFFNSVVFISDKENKNKFLKKVDSLLNNKKNTKVGCDKKGNISLVIGNNNMTNEELIANIKDVLIFSNLPTFKGRKIKSISLSSTNSPSISLNNNL